MKISRSKLSWWIPTLNSMTRTPRSKWTSTSISTPWQMYIRLESILRKPKTDTTKWPLNFKQNLMKSKPSVMKLNNNSKNWNEVLLKMQSTREQVRRFTRISWESGMKVNHSRTKKCTSTDFRTSLWETGLLIRRRSWRRRNNWQMVSTWLISNSSRLRIKLWTRRLKKETKSCTDLEIRLQLTSLSCLILVKSFNSPSSRTRLKTRSWKNWETNFQLTSNRRRIWRRNVKRPTAQTRSWSSRQVL